MCSSYTMWYIYACEPIFYYRNLFLGIITTTSLMAFVIQMMPSMNKPKFRTFRAVMYIVLGISAGIP